MRLALPALAFLILAAAPFMGFGDGFFLTLLARAMILAMAALSLSFLVGGAGLVSLGHAAMLGIGAYAVAALDSFGLNGFIVFPVAILAGAGFAGLTGLVALRTSGVHFIMITLAFGQMAFFTCAALASLGGDDGYALSARTEIFHSRLLENRLAFHFICLGLLALVWGGLEMVMASRFGRVLRAAKQNAVRTRAMGFGLFSYRWVAYVLAGGIAGLAGALLANTVEFVSPAALGWNRSGELLFMVILGGAAQLQGAILGAVAIVLLEEWLSHITAYWKLVFGPMLVLCVLFLPQGLAGLGLARLGRRDG